MPVNEAAFVQPRLAASVMLVRDAPFEVLMVKRNERGPFASAFVFPGGVVEENDYSESWLPYLQSNAHSIDRECALRIAACRETWEEVSILPGGRAGAVAKDKTPPRSFFDCITRDGIRLALNELVLFSHWITPVF